MTIDAQDTHNGTDSDGVSDDECDASERRNSVADRRYNDGGTLIDNIDVDHDTLVRHSVVGEDDRIEDDAMKEARNNQDERNELERNNVADEELERNDVAEEEFYDARMRGMDDTIRVSTGNEEGDCLLDQFDGCESQSSRSGNQCIW